MLRGIEAKRPRGSGYRPDGWIHSLAFDATTLEGELQISHYSFQELSVRVPLRLLQLGPQAKAAELRRESLTRQRRYRRRKRIRGDRDGTRQNPSPFQPIQQGILSRDSI